MHSDDWGRAAPHHNAPPDMAGQPWLQLSCCCRGAAQLLPSVKTYLLLPGCSWILVKLSLNPCSLGCS